MSTTNGNGHDGALVVHQPQPVGLMSNDEIDRSWRLATALSQSGFFKDARGAEQAFAKILFGRDLGLSPTQAMTAIHIVEGKPEMSANLQAQMVKTYRGVDGERYDYRITEHTDDVCALEIKRRDPGQAWELLGVERFTMDDAKRAGLANRGPWKTYPRNMLFARCISNGVNAHCPEVMRGLRVYHEGEINGHAVDVAPDAPVEPAVPDAEVVDAEPVQEAPAMAEPKPTVEAASVAQRKLIFAKAKEHGVAEDVLRQIFVQVADTPHSDRIPKDKVDPVLVAIAAVPA